MGKNEDNKKSPKVKEEKSLKLDIPSSSQECLDVSGFGETVVISMSAMARMDDILTLEEYEALIYGVDYLADISEHPLLFRVLALNSLFTPISFDKAIKQVSKYSKNQSLEIRKAIITGLVPLLSCQGNESKKYATMWAKALDLNDEVLSIILENLPNDEESGFLNRMKFLMKSEKDSIQSLKSFAITFKDEELYKYIIDNEKDLKNNKGLKKLHLNIQKASDRTLKKLNQRLPKLKELEPQEVAAKKFKKVTDMLVEQIKQRLKFISKRLDLQQDLFNEDMSLFIESTTDLVEVGMRDMMQGRVYSWADKGLWEKFANTDAAQRVQLRYKPLDARYYKIFNLWNQELEEFSVEIHDIVKSVFDNIDPLAFSKLVKSEHQSVEIANKIDFTADLTIGGTVLVVVGGVVAIAMGALPAASIAAAAAFMVTNPVGWVIGGALGLTMLWKLISNPNDRQIKFIKDKREQLKLGLMKLLEDPEQKHKNTCLELEKEFYHIGSKYYAPLVRDSYLSMMQPQLEAQVIRRVREDTKKACEKIQAIGTHLMIE